MTYLVHEGEIVVKEKYGSKFNRYYVKPTEQSNVVMLDEEKKDNVRNLFVKIFLPQGYPDSVSKDYINYQIWDTAQAFCSTISGTLATQEVLRGVGVGDNAATPLAATITWVLKDGCGHLARIYFAYSHGTYLDAYSKKWRLYADTLNDAAMCMEIALPMFGSYTTVVLCLSTMMKAIVGVAGGATRIAMTQHHAIRGNMADVSAKDSAQETAVNLIASMAALLIITILGSSLWIFAIMTAFHIIFNYLAVRAVCLRTLNEPRFLKIIDTYLQKEIIMNPCDVNMSEPIVFYQLGANILDLKVCGFKIKLGQSLKRVVDKPKAKYIKDILCVYKSRNYIIIPSIRRRKMFVLLRSSAGPDDILCAYFHAVLLSTVICSLNNYPLAILTNKESSTRPFAQVCNTLQDVEWSRDVMETPTEHFKFEPSIELMAYLVDIVQKEWDVMKPGLAQIGWDLKKHLLIVDEWRIASPKLEVSETQEPLIEFEPISSDIVYTSRGDHSKQLIDREICTIEPEELPQEKISQNDIDDNVKITNSKMSAAKLNRSSKDIALVNSQSRSPLDDCLCFKTDKKSKS